MAEIAIRWRVGVAISMAIRTRRRAVRAGERKCRIIVIKRCRFPRRGAVADGAVVVKIAGLVIGIVGATEILFMTGETIRGCARIAFGVAIAARHRAVRAGERKRGVVVIERRRFPCRGAVANSTVMIKIICHMIWIVGAAKVVFVAGVTVRWRAGVNVVHMAIRARHGLMRAGERKCGAIVIKIRRLPGILRVTGGAVMRIIGSHMIRIRSAAIVRFVTAKAVAR